MKPPDRKFLPGVIRLGVWDAYVTFRKIVHAKPMAVRGLAWFVPFPIPYVPTLLSLIS
jgi:hypothetical protein